MQNVHVFVPVFLYAVTMLIFQIKRIISSKKWFKFVVTFFFLENAKILGRSDDAKQRKKNEDSHRFLCHRFQVVCGTGAYMRPGSF